MPTYRSYGLVIASAIALPELPQTTGDPPDVHVERRDVTRDATEALNERWELAVDGSTLRLVHEEVGAFAIEQGRRILVDPDPDTSEALLRHHLLGPVLGALLHQRGRLVLHGSGVEIGERVVGFLGGVGAGKSTIAAACTVNGGRFIADDVIAIGWSTSPRIPPGPSFLKLSDEVAEYLARPWPVESRSDLPKDYHWTDDRAASEPQPLDTLYVLDPGERPAIGSLSEREAAIELFRHSYAATLLEPTGTAERHFEQCTRLANAIPVKRLGRGSSLEALSTVVERVSEDGVDA